MSVQVSPDGSRYLALALGERTCRPFHYRWLVPLICGGDARLWSRLRAGALLALLPLGYCYAGGGLKGLCVAIVPAALAGVWSLNWRLPVLVDAEAMALALASAVCAQHELWWAAILFALVAGATKETSPVFAALWAWSPILLVGLLMPAARACMKAGPDQVTSGVAHEAIEHPFQTAWHTHRESLTEPALWFLPWGALLLAFAAPTWQLSAVVVVAYGQCVAATDRVRLYQWAWPVLAVHAFDVVPQSWWLFVLVIHFAHPWRTDGV